MPQARDEAGNIWETDAQGNAVRLIQAAGGPQMPADPKYPYEGLQAAADVVKTETDIVDTRADNVREDKKLEASLFAKGLRIAPNGTVERIPGWKPAPHERSASAIEQETKTQGKRDKAAVVRAIMGEVRDRYERSIKGQPARRLWGATEFIDSIPANEDFSKTADGMLALIRPMVAMGAKDGDSDKEMEVFRAYIPSADDSDRTIESKLNNLEILLSGVIDGKLPSQVAATGGLTGKREDAAAALRSGTDKGNAMTNLRLSNAPPALKIAEGGGSQTVAQYPPEMEAKHDQMVQQLLTQGGGRIDPQAYAQAKAALAEQFGFRGDTQSDIGWAQGVNDYLESGGKTIPTGLQPMERDLSLNETINDRLFNNSVGGFAFGVGDQIGIADEMAGGFKSLVGGTDYATEVARANAMKQAMQDAYPKANFAGNLTGAVLSGAAIAKAFPKVATALTANGKRAVASGSTFGGLSGAGEMNDERLTGLALGTGLGGLGGGAGVAASPVFRSAMGSAPGQAVDRGARSLWNHTGGKILPSMRANAAPDVPQFNRGEGLLPAEVLESAIPNLEDADRLGLPYSLADADPKLRMLAGSVSRRSPDARQMAENIFEPRALDQAERATDAIGTHLAPVVNVAERGKQWREAAQTASAPFYAQGRARAAPVDPRVEAMLGTPVGQRALGNAREMAANEGRDPNAMGFDLNEQGEVFIRDMPSWETLDLVKRGIDQELAPFRNQFTGKLDLEGNPQAQAIEGFRQRFVGTLDDLNPDYAQARGAYQGQIRNRDALQRGEMAFSGQRVKPRDIPQITGGFDDTQMGEFRRGAASRLGDDVADASLGSNPYQRIYGSTTRQGRIAEVFEPQGVANFDRTYNLERDMAKTAHETLGGSPTAARQAMDGQFDSGLMGMGADMAADAAGGGGLFTAKNLAGRGLRFLGDTARLKGGKAKADAIAPILYEPDPRITLDYLADLQARQAAQAARNRRYASGSGLIGSVLPSAFLGSE